MLQWHSHVSAVTSGALCLLVAVWLVLLYRRMIRRMPRRRALLLLAPKAAAALLLLFAFFEPAWTVERPLAAQTRLLAVIDASDSMAVPDGGTPRRERARKLVESLRAALSHGAVLETVEFDTQLHDPHATTNKSVAAGPRGTDLGACLNALAERADIASYADVIVLTDGGDEEVRDVPLPPVPVSFVGIGTDPATWRDVAVAEIQAPPSAENGTRFEIAADLESRTAGDAAFAARLAAVPVKLDMETATGTWQRVAEAPADLTRGRARVRFETAADAPGIRRYRIAIDPLAGELSPLNNARTFPVDVRRKSIHVLYFTRELGLDFKMLRNELARDPGIAFTALFRTMSERFTVQGERIAGDDELDAGFPTSEKTLALYDVIIVGSFPAKEWNRAQMQALVTYVNEGGSALFLGGEDSFGRGGYADTPLAILFPWRVAPDEPDLLRGTFPVSIPPAAVSHPALAGLDALLAQEGGPSLESLNMPGQPAPAATTLLEARAGTRPVAAVALMPYGKGKVIGLASNTFWKWARRSKPLGEAYGRFWRQAVRFLAGEVEGGRVLGIMWDRDQYRPGEQAVAQVRVAGQAADKARLTATLNSDAGTTTLGVDPDPAAAGAFKIRIPFPKRGTYTLRIEARSDALTLESYEKTIRVAPLLDEGTRLAVDEDYLKRLAARTGGLFVREDATGPLETHLKSRLAKRTSVVETPLAESGPWYVAAFLAILLLEWILRRRFYLV